jgi:hypothetical protein
MTAVNRPKLGAVQQLNVQNLPAGATIAAISIGFTPVVPGLSLNAIGMTGCFQNSAIDISVSFAVTGTSQPFPLTIPSTPNFAGLHIYLQAISTAPGINVTNVIASNGLDLAMNIN